MLKDDVRAAKRQLLHHRIKLPVKNPDMTLRDAREQIKDDLAAGKSCTCPACGQTAKLYSRKLRAPWLKALKALNESLYLNPREMVAVCGARDYPTLAQFGLALRSKDGYWRITQTGKDFLAGRILLPKAVLLFNKTAIGFDESTNVSVEDVLPEAFSIGDILDESAVTDAAINPFSQPSRNDPIATQRL